MMKPCWCFTLGLGIALTVSACGGSGGSDNNATGSNGQLDKQAKLTFVNTARDQVDAFVKNGADATSEDLFTQTHLKAGPVSHESHREYTHRWGGSSALDISIGIWDSKYQLEEEPAQTNTQLNSGENWWVIAWLNGETTNSFQVTSLRRSHNEVPSDQYQFRVFSNTDIRIDYESATASGATNVSAGKVSSPILMAGCNDQFEVSATKGEAGTGLVPQQLNLCGIPDLQPGDAYLLITSDDEILYAVQE
ncbi:hypothetical protein [Photobacterium galatheae]|uniref:Lipoprotein n=1 Tax=Photobacterium galatheae TaxID=1654360 RepID=A0A066RUX7_9GAMM|nr:hypothetical protein [Photobacterium galatheae]KDM91517.1 hypothetical protein EA58_10860 [Photobacterium galatheae]MCM0149590.1 hypothetical protein [Photobacterium galatheae]